MNERHFVSETDMEPCDTRLLLFVERSNVYGSHGKQSSRAAVSQGSPSFCTTIIL